MRDFLYSEVAAHYGIANVPDNEKLALEVGTQLSQNLLEPLQSRFGRLHIRFAYRSCHVNEIGNKNGHNCAKNEDNYAGHIWDREGEGGRKGATACIVIPAFFDQFGEEGNWTQMAWWIHDRLPYCSLEFFPHSKRWAFNITWSDMPIKKVTTWASWMNEGKWTRKRVMTQSGMPNNQGDHSTEYADLSKVFDL